jgi:NADPH:quinone reductase-like Zn-dependent oxidoreductase
MKCCSYVKPGSRVLINGGSGGTGTFGIQVAKALGCTVTTTCSGANVELCRSLGADEVIDYRSTDLISHLKKTHSKQEEQFDLLVDNVDTPALYFNSQAYLKPEGRYITIAGSISLSSTLSMIQILYLPSWLGGGKRASQFLLRKSDVEQFSKIAELMKEGKVKAVVEKEYPLEETGEAFARLKSGRTVGKSVIKVGGE